MRQFSDLKPEEKVAAVLGGVMEPVKRELALGFAEIDYEKLTDVEKKEVDAVFNAYRVKDPEGRTDLYRGGGLPNGVELDEVDKQITKVMLEHFSKSAERK